MDGETPGASHGETAPFWRRRLGALARLAEGIGAADASIKQVAHERVFGGADVSTVQVHCMVETRDRAHVEPVIESLRGPGIHVVERAAVAAPRLSGATDDIC